MPKSKNPNHPTHLRKNKLPRDIVSDMWHVQSQHFNDEQKSFVSLFLDTLLYPTQTYPEGSL